VLLTSKLCYEFINFPDFRQFDVENEPAGSYRTSFDDNRTGPDGKNWSGSNSEPVTNSPPLLQSKPVKHLDSSMDVFSASLASERFNYGDSSFEISEYGYVAKYSGRSSARSAVVFGLNDYSNGIHQIRFRIEKKEVESFFFGIVTSSQNTLLSVFQSDSSLYGWHVGKYTIEHGQIQQTSPEMNLSIGDEITMELYCDQKYIYFYCHRTRQFFNISVNTEHCPFPWRLAISLSPHSSVRIIPKSL